MKKLFLIITLLNLILIGCSASNEKDQTADDEMREMIEVDLQVPEKANSNEEVEIRAHVTQGEENVEDAYEVKFEIWKSGEDHHDMIDSKHSKDGVYPITYTFKEDGIYYIISHVTARGMHNMPKKEIIVGNPDDTSKEEEHDHHSTVDFEFATNEEPIVNKEVILQTTIKHGKEPLFSGNVTFEVWKEGEEKHHFISATDKGNGQYTATFTPTSDGTYHVNVHVKKDNIHDHYLTSITVSK